MIVTLPSGLSGEIRGLTGLELHKLSDPKFARGVGFVDALLKQVWVRTVEPGIYAFETPDWGKVLLGDRFVALVEVRTISLGSDYPFSLQCTSCRERYEWEVDLPSLLRQELPDESKRLFREGNRFTTEIDGAEVTFRLALGTDEATMLKHRRAAGGQFSMVDALALQVLRVEGIAENPQKVRRWLESQSMLDLEDLQAELQRVDCGIETDIQTECPHCQWVQDVKLPFGEDFFKAPKKRKPREAPSPATTAKSPERPPSSEPLENTGS